MCSSDTNLLQLELCRGLHLGEVELYKVAVIRALFCSNQLRSNIIDFVENFIGYSHPY